MKRKNYAEIALKCLIEKRVVNLCPFSNCGSCQVKLDFTKCKETIYNHWIEFAKELDKAETANVK